MREGLRVQGAGCRVPDWGRFVGIPYADHGRDFAGCDCWGLVRLVYREEFGVELPDLGPYYASIEDAVGKRAAFDEHAPLWRKVGRPRPGDAVLLRIAGERTHVAVAVSDSQMLHVRRGADAVIERMDSPLWRNRLDGFYRLNEIRVPAGSSQ